MWGLWSVYHLLICLVLKVAFWGLVPEHLSTLTTETERQLVIFGNDGAQSPFLLRRSSGSADQSWTISRARRWKAARGSQQRISWAATVPIREDALFFLLKWLWKYIHEMGWRWTPAPLHLIPGVTGFYNCFSKHDANLFTSLFTYIHVWIYTILNIYIYPLIY